MMLISPTTPLAGGYKEEAVMEKWNFHDQFHTFHSQGYARAETGGGAGVIGSVPSFYAKEGAGAVAAEAAAESERRRELKRKAKEEEADVGGMLGCCSGGFWAGGLGSSQCRRPISSITNKQTKRTGARGRRRRTTGSSRSWRPARSPRSRSASGACLFVRVCMCA
jgi:hypothetical protein